MYISTNFSSFLEIDEIDGVLPKRSENKHLRSLVNAFLTELTAPGNAGIRCTNVPWDIDDAARRRFGASIYVPLPNEYDRAVIIAQCFQKVLKNESRWLAQNLAAVTEGY
jgi:SpoVK/Ycf46/Vps4 family AAA+-type ATPase